MALTVETGTGAANSESYASVADADTYHTLRGNTNWIDDVDMTTAAKEAALRRATDYMNQAYRMRWNGNRINTTQALDWPRANVPQRDFSLTGFTSYYATDSIPVEVKNACMELAFRAAAGELAGDLTQGIKREKVDVLEVEYDNYSPQYTRYRSIELLLATFFSVTGSGINKAVVRV